MVNCEKCSNYTYCTDCKEYFVFDNNILACVECEEGTYYDNSTKYIKNQ